MHGNNSEPVNEEQGSKSKIMALKIMGNRRLSSSEIKKRLIKRGESEDIAQITTQWLENMGIINDQEYAILIVRHYLSRGYGIARINDELYKRGIPKDLWDEATEEICEDDVIDAADIFLQKKLKGEFDHSDVRKASDALVRRGFTYDQAKSAINRYLQNE